LLTLSVLTLFLVLLDTSFCVCVYVVILHPLCRLATLVVFFFVCASRSFIIMAYSKFRIECEIFAYRTNISDEIISKYCILTGYCMILHDTLHTIRSYIHVSHRGKHEFRIRICIQISDAIRIYKTKFRLSQRRTPPPRRHSHTTVLYRFTSSSRAWIYLACEKHASLAQVLLSSSST